MEENPRVKISQAIAEQRKAHNLTQKELGDRLNLSPQAVSKWEKGLAEPDIDTLMKMCTIFGVTLNELCGLSPESVPTGESGAAEPSESAEASEPSEVAATQASEASLPVSDAPRVILGYCHRCKKPLYHPDEYTVHNRRGGNSITYCKNCEKEMHDESVRSDYRAHAYETKKSFIIGGVLGGVALLVFLIAFLVVKPFGEEAAGVSVVLAILGGVAAFTFFTQMFWDDSTVQNFFGFFIRSFRMPGVIFTLDIGGIIFLITVKILLAVLGAIASVLFFLLGGLVFTPIASVFIFPFALLARIVKENKLKSAADKTQQAQAPKAE